MMRECCGYIDGHIIRTVQLLFSRGIRLEFGSDFSQFKELSGSVVEKGEIHPAFDPDEDLIEPLKGLWIIGRNNKEQIVHTQAIKLLDLGEREFGSYLLDHLSDFRFGGWDLDFAQSQIHLTRAASEMTGQLTYHGELWLKGGPDGIRGGAEAALLTRLLLMIVQVKWSPDFMIGFQSPQVCCRGLSLKEGYARNEQRSLLWHRKDGGEPLEDWLVWMSREEALFNLRIPPTDIQALLDKPVRPKPQLAPAALAA